MNAIQTNAAESNKSSSGNAHSTPAASTTAANGLFQSSASNDTLVHDSERDVQYEPPHDYDNDENQDEDESGDGEVYATTISNMAPTMTIHHANRSVVTIGSSPLTPRQIKQRNTAKRNSISKTNNAALLLNTSIGSSQSEEYFTPNQLRDLAFLQSQKFDADFIRTTNELFNRYPSAKISISVINGNSASTSSQVTRQVEIDRAMFDKVCAYQAQQQQQQAQHQQSTSCVPDVLPKQAKIQPPAPVRTTSCLSESACNNNNNNNNTLTRPHQNDFDLTDNKTKIMVQKPSNAGQQQLKQQQFNQPETVKSELERAIENRLRRVSLNSQQQTTEGSSENSASNGIANIVNNNSIGTNNRNMPRDPPPPIPHSNTCPNIESAAAFPPPPSPKELRRLTSTTITASVFTTQSTSATNTVTNPMNTTNALNGVAGSFSSPPPPPPLPFSLTSPVPPAPPLALSFENMKPLNSTVTTTMNINNSSVTAERNESGNGKVSVKSIVSTYQAQQIVQQQQQPTASGNDPRMSSDFSALIAKKAAEKRAKFQENPRPITANAVTYIASDSGKVAPVITAAAVAQTRVVIYSSEESKVQQSEFNVRSESVSKNDDNNNGKVLFNLFYV